MLKTIIPTAAVFAAGWGTALLRANESSESHALQRVLGVGLISIWYLSLAAWETPPARLRSGAAIILASLFAGWTDFDFHHEEVDWVLISLVTVGVPAITWVVTRLLGGDRSVYYSHWSAEHSIAFRQACISYCIALGLSHFIAHPAHYYLGLIACGIVRMLLIGPLWAGLLIAESLSTKELLHSPIRSSVKLARTFPIVRLLMHPVFWLLGLIGF